MSASIWDPAGTTASDAHKIISVTDFPYLAKGDGSDDTAALTLAFSQIGKRIRVPAGIFYYTADLLPTCAAIVGDGERVSILKPGPLCTAGLSIQGLTVNYPTLIQELYIDGVNTNGAVGLDLGNSAAGSIALEVNSVRIVNFVGTGSPCGMRCGNVLKSTFNKVTTQHCGTGLIIKQPSASSWPTTLLFTTCVFTDSLTHGGKIYDGYQIVFINTDFESAVNEGLLIDGAVYNRVIQGVYLGPGCHFEANNIAAGPTGYNVRVVAGASSVEQFVINAAEFPAGILTYASRMVSISGLVRDFRIKDPVIAGFQNTEYVTISGGANGRIEGWTLNLPYELCVNVDAASLEFGPYGKSSVKMLPAALPSYAIAGNTVAHGREPALTITGAGVLKTIPVAQYNGGAVIIIIPAAGATWTWDATGNIAIAGTAVPGKQLQFLYDKGTSKWYPSYV